jgi:spermidine synthase
MRKVVILLFFLSGVCGLIYEVVWQRLLSLGLGITTYSTTVILAAYLGGLALGSWWFGRLADKFKQPLKLYAFLEIGIGVVAFCFPFLNTAETFIFTDINIPFFWVNILKILVSFLVLLVPTFLMGGTFPVISKYYITHPSTIGRNIGTLYGSNVLGAVAGCFLAGFILIPQIGSIYTIYLAAALNIIIGVFALIVNRNLPSLTLPLSSSNKSKKIVKYEIEPLPDNIYRLMYIAAGITGFCSLAYEVLWGRTLVVFLHTSIVVFATMLTTFLCGYALGSLVFARFFDKTKHLLRLFGVFQLLITLSSLLSIWQFTHLGEMMGNWYARYGMGWNAFVMIGFGASAIIMFVPSFFMGASYPLLNRIYARKMETLGNSVGSCYAVNSIGAVLGSIIAGFVLIPLIGITTSLIIISSINAILGFVVLWTDTYRKHWHRAAFVLVPLGFILLLLLKIPFSTPLVLYSNNFDNRKDGQTNLFYKEGTDATITVTYLMPNKIDSKRYKNIEVNGVSVAGNNKHLRTTQKIQGHVPLLLFRAMNHHEAKTAFILGFGTGEASSCILKHGMKRVDCLELASPEIEANSHFSTINDNVLKKKNFNLIINDARNHLLIHDIKYDIIQSDAVHPDMAFNTYTKEYYALCSKRLSDDGIFSAWIPIFHFSPQNLKILLKTLHEVFPYISIWYSSNFNNKHAILIGSKKKINIDLTQFELELNKPAVFKSLGEVKLNNAVNILNTFVADEQTIVPELVDVPVNTDDNLIIPFGILKQEQKGEQTVAPCLSFFNKVSKPVYANMLKLSDTSAMYEKMKKYYLARKNIFNGMGNYYAQDIEGSINEYTMANAIYPNDYGINFLLDEVRYLNFYNKGSYYYANGEPEKAMDMFEHALKIIPGNFWALNYMGSILLQQGKIPESIEMINRAIKVSPDYFMPYLNLGYAYFAQNDFPSGIRQFQAAYSLNPFSKRAKEIIDKYNSNKN